MSKKVIKPAAAKAPLKTNRSLFERWEGRLKANQRTVLLISLAVSLVYSIFLFDVRISELNDDSLYIEGGYNFSRDIRHAFTANAPLYPLILSIPIKLFGINLVILKSLSVVFTLLHLWFLFLAFRNRIPYLVLFPVMMVLAVNSFIQYFASLTFTEALYMFLQSLLIYCFFIVFDKTKGNNSIKTTWKYWLMLGGAVFLLNFCKNIGVGAIAAIIFMFLVEKRWIHAAYSLAGIMIVRLSTDFIRNAIWHTDQFSSQSGMLRQIDPYNAAKGYETTAGFIQRFFDNTNLYIGKRLYQMLGFMPVDSTETKPGLILITAILFVIALVAALKRKNKAVLFSIIFSLIMMALTFIVLQKQWDQARYVMVYLPYILIIFFYAIYTLVEKKESAVQFIYIIAAGIFFFSSFISSTAKAAGHFNELKRNIAGDIYYGYSEDWVNFLKMSSYCADSLPPGTKAASRKAPMSFIYADGKPFFPVYNVFSENPDSILTTFRENGVTHVIVASLRRNPKKADGYIINTMNRLLQPVAQKYPGKLVLVKQIGESEPAYLYEIKY